MTWTIGRDLGMGAGLEFQRCARVPEVVRQDRCVSVSVLITSSSSDPLVIERRTVIIPQVARADPLFF